MMLLMALLWLATIGLILALAWRLIAGGGWPGVPPRRRRAEDILRERYASGEIDRDTYLRMMAELQPPAEH